MTTQAERNKALVLEYLEVYRTFDPERYETYLADDPVYRAGMNVRRGREAFRANTEAGKLLYPKPDEAVVDVEHVLADDHWVAVLLMRRAVTNKGLDYENVYSFFFEIVDGKIQTQVELLDFRVSTEKFDLSVLEPRPQIPS
jgi:ketosteroid isomerase-like protein